MATRIKRILVAIRDLEHTPRDELRKAAAFARPAQARIELFHAVDALIPSRNLQWDFGGNAKRRYVDDMTQHLQRQLDRFKRSPYLEGLRVTSHIGWDYPPHEAIVRRALAIRADLVIAGTRSHGITGRLLLRNTDWELIRQCPSALLLVKSSRAYERPVIVAAVDPFHQHAKPADLDALLLRTGAGIASLLGGSLHAFHAYMPLVNTMPMPGALSMPMTLPPEVEDTHGAQIARAFDRLAKRAGIASADRHLHMGDVSTELNTVVKRTGASIALMGAVSRSGLRRIFIGSTAERALDDLSCDVLIVKPRGFKTGIARRPSSSVKRSSHSSELSR
jgi:universal stress protein E